MAVTQVIAGGEIPSSTKLNEKSLPVVTSTADISSPYVGQLIFNNTNKKLYRCSSIAPVTWVPYVGGPTWNLVRSASQSITAALTHQAVQWDTEEDDPDGVHSGTSANVVITQAGLYGVAAKTSFVGGAAANRRASRIMKNGVEVKGGLVVIPVTSTAFSFTVVIPTVYLRCIVGDTLSVSLWAETTGVSTGAGSDGDLPIFTGAWLHD